MNIEILYEDNDIVVINKPAGLVVHADGRTMEQNVCQWFVKHCPDARTVGEPTVLSDGRSIERPGVVHRLDRETSGVMVLAKTQEAHAFLKAQFQNREVKKIYNAFVYGLIKEDDGVIDRPIGRSKKDMRIYSAQRGARGLMRPALTRWHVIERGASFTFLELAPKTGRTHQLRVHLKAINYPIVCDRLYAPVRPCSLGFGRVALHARRLGIKLLKGEERFFEAPLPPDFAVALEELRQGAAAS